MKFTQLQVREIIGLSQETLRYWRRILPPLQGRKGKSARFTAGDILALLIINEVVDSFGVNIAVIASISSQLFEQCQGVRWHQFRDRFLAIDARAANVSPMSKSGIILPSDGPLLILDIEKYLGMLRDSLTSDELTQTAFPFGPMAVPKRRASRT